MLSTNRSWSYDFAYDVTATSAAIGFCVFCDINTDTDAVTSFRIELTPNFNTPSFIYAWVCSGSSTLLLLRVAKILRGKWG